MLNEVVPQGRGILVVLEEIGDDPKDRFGVIMHVLYQNVSKLFVLRYIDFLIYTQSLQYIEGVPIISMLEEVLV